MSEKHTDPQYSVRGGEPAWSRSGGKGQLYIISGPSGSGKDTLLERLFWSYPMLEFSISSVTRNPRAGEVPGQKYNFITRELFSEMLDKGEFLEYNEYLGNLYGTPKQPVIDAMERGKDVILEVDVNGAAKIREMLPCMSIFIMPPSMEVLADRLLRRSTEDDETAKRRLNAALGEIARAGEYDYIVVNGDLNEATNSLASIIISNQLKIENQKFIIDEVLKDAQSFDW